MATQPASAPVNGPSTPVNAATAPLVVVGTPIAPTAPVSAVAAPVVAQAAPKAAKPARKAASGGKAAKATRSSVTCNVCGKHLLAGTSLVRGIGPTCISQVLSHLPAGTNPLTVAQSALTAAISAVKGTPVAQYAHSRVAGSIPATSYGTSHIKVATVHLYLKAAGVPISLLVRAFGGDKCLMPALNPYWQPTYVGKTRYLHPLCGTVHGIAQLKAMAQGKTIPAMPKAL